MDALTYTTEEGRGRLRKVSGSCQQALNREYPNGETRRGSCREHRALNKIGVLKGNHLN